MRTEATEQDVKSACIGWLNSLPGVSVWKQNTGGRHWTDNTGKSRYQPIGTPGQADLTGILRPGGVRIEIELKKPGEKPTGKRGLLQLSWLENIRESGGIAFWCDSLDSCVQQMRFEWIRRGWLWSARWECK